MAILALKGPTMKRALILAVGMAILVAWPAPRAHAQADMAQTVSACGTPNNTPVVGYAYAITMDPSGKLCTNGSGGGGTVAGNQSNAGGGTTGSTNIGSNSYNYGWNGTSWVQILTDNLGDLTIKGTGTAGTPSGGVLTVQGSNAGNPLPVSGAVNPAPATTAALGITPTVTTTATVNSAVATGANLYGFDLTQGTTAGYFAFVNAASAVGTGTAISPRACVYVAAGGSLRVRQDIPDRFVSGIQVYSTTSCTTYTANTPVLMAVLYQ